MPYPIHLIIAVGFRCTIYGLRPREETHPVALSRMDAAAEKPEESAPSGALTSAMGGSPNKTSLQPMRRRTLMERQSDKKSDGGEAFRMSERIIKNTQAMTDSLRAQRGKCQSSINRDTEDLYTIERTLDDGLGHAALRRHGVELDVHLLVPPLAREGAGLILAHLVRELRRRSGAHARCLAPRNLRGERGRPDPGKAAQRNDAGGPARQTQNQRRRPTKP